MISFQSQIRIYFWKLIKYVFIVSEVVLFSGFKEMLRRAKVVNTRNKNEQMKKRRSGRKERKRKRKG